MANEPVDYNYDKFTMDPFPVDYGGPKAGEAMADFQAVDVDGKAVRLSEFEGRFVVLETGSYTCPIYVGNIDPMAEVVARYPEVQWLVIYTREAHPGESIGAHESFEDKQQLACRLIEDYNERRQVLVDDLDGSVHRMLGGLPNQFYVLSPSRKVMMRGDWIKPEAIDEILSTGDPDAISEQQYFDPAKPSLWRFFGIMKKGGLRAALEFVLSFPAFLRHQRAKKPR